MTSNIKLSGAGIMDTIALGEEDNTISNDSVSNDPSVNHSEDTQNLLSQSDQKPLVDLLSPLPNEAPKVDQFPSKCSHQPAAKHARRKRSSHGGNRKPQSFFPRVSSHYDAKFLSATRNFAKTHFVSNYAGSWITNMTRGSSERLCRTEDTSTNNLKRLADSTLTSLASMSLNVNLAMSPLDGRTEKDDDSAIGRSSASPDPALKVDDNSPGTSISGQEESYECYGEAKGSDTVHTPSHHRSQSQGETPLGRRSWLRTSLRRSARSNKRPGPPNGLGSPVFRSPSFNSSGRSSNCDVDDMYSDVSLEDDVNDLNHKVQVLERQVTVLAENQNNGDDRYTRSKQENAELTARLIMLEEQLRDVETRAAEQLDNEKRRHKELMQRLEREKVLEIENHQIKMLSLEKELRFAEAEAERCRQQFTEVTAERRCLDERLDELQMALDSAREETKMAAEMERRGRQEREEERDAQALMMSDLTRELEDTRRSADMRLKTETDESGLIRMQHSELETELRQLKQENKELEESNQELQAQLLTTGLQEGMQLLNSGSKSLAAELEDMSADQVDNAETVQKLKKSLQEQQECNKQLRTYIDGILLNIVENYPELLEVKHKH